ncbi:DsbA family protein [Streptomyces sp. 12297]
MRRLIVAAVAGVAVLVVAGCGSQAQPADGKDAGTALPTPYAGAWELPEKLAADGTTIVVGDPAAATTVRLYEDPRCPVVEDFEATGAVVLREMTLRRKARTEYTFASFKDDRLGGDGSKRAVNALRAALDAGKFAEFHTVLFEDKAATDVAGGYTTASLLKLASQVKGLRSASFDSAVTTLKYKDFVTASEKAYEAAGGEEDPRGPGTPTVAINGTQVTADLYSFLFEEDSFALLLNQ